MKNEVKMWQSLAIFGTVCILIVDVMHGIQIKCYEEQIEEFEQRNAQLQEEENYYIERSQMLENIIVDSGIVVDNCECY